MVALARMNSEQLREKQLQKMYISSKEKKEKENKTFTGILTPLSKGEALFHFAKNSDRQREKQVGDGKELDVSVLYCHPAAVFTVVVTTKDNSSLNSLHGPHL